MATYTGDMPKFSETQKLQNILKQCHITANISKFSDSANAPKNLENMCNYASIFDPGNGGKI